MTARRIAAVIALLASALPSAAVAQSYPLRLVQIVVPFGPGSATDTIARMIGQHISEATGQPVVVENKAGANGFLGVQAVTRAPPDGYMIQVTTQTTQAANLSLFKKLPYDPVKDLAPVSGLSQGALVLVVRKTLGARTLAELTELAKAQPGRLSFAAGNASARAGGELYRMLAWIDLIHVAYRSAPQAINDLIGGSIDMMFSHMVVGLPAVQAGQVRALAVTSSRRNPNLPDVPTMAEAGLPGHELTAWTAMYVPAGTPSHVIERLNQLVHETVESPRFKQMSGAMANETIAGIP